MPTHKSGKDFYHVLTIDGGASVDSASVTPVQNVKIYNMYLASSTNAVSGGKLAISFVDPNGKEGLIIELTSALVITGMVAWPYQISGTGGSGSTLMLTKDMKLKIKGANSVGGNTMPVGSTAWLTVVGEYEDDERDTDISD